MTTDDLPEHVQRNRAAWDSWASSYVEPARRAWASAEIRWGELHVREADIHALPLQHLQTPSQRGTIRLVVSTAVIDGGQEPRCLHPSPAVISSVQTAGAEHLTSSEITGMVEPRAFTQPVAPRTGVERHHVLADEGVPDHVHVAICVYRVRRHSVRPECLVAHVDYFIANVVDQTATVDGQQIT